MTAYALAQVHSIDPDPDVTEYLRRIDATLDAFGGRFAVHRGKFETLEGSWGALGLILIEFPDYERARAWYDSPAYQEILELRTRHMAADVIIAEGVPVGYRAEHRFEGHPA
ncbi:hypothetical protein Kpho02_77670 [Kitasatospora phosalacinea]|uniref:DUF1330 domain-containing protein n=1 Tax=Kitasatospora phosalacinea TaxID=2065 RepID=A0A9W6V7P6_9ACTN|nr:DUF1330 domain-containing protein [Kitasatospora phosalacinea]GLW75470.1 hypothetical protein Kpho02_77670 [Kitasatospora phosalacinea]